MAPPLAKRKQDQTYPLTRTIIACRVELDSETSHDPHRSAPQPFCDRPSRKTLASSRSPVSVCPLHVQQHISRGCLSVTAAIPCCPGGPGFETTATEDHVMTSTLHFISPYRCCVLSLMLIDTTNIASQHTNLPSWKRASAVALLSSLLHSCSMHLKTRLATLGCPGSAQ